MADPSPTIGALMVGGIVGATLYGLTCSQGFMYYNRGVKDSNLMRGFVLALWLVDSLNVILMGHMLYYTFITRYGDPSVFSTPLWSLVAMVLSTAIVSFMVRGMYIKGIWHLSHEHPIITGVLALLSLFDFVCGIALSVKGFRVSEGELPDLKVYLYLNFASAVLADGAVAGTLFNLLRGARTGNARTDTALGRLMLYTVNTGLLTVADGGVALITFAIMPDNFVFLTPFMVLSHFYTNALFASLNSRTLIKSSDHVVSLQIPIQTVVQTRVDGSGSDNEDLKSQYSLAKAL
ncbi:hypothetical protein ONZ51_g3958 [Trametes cubensis]|uniref:DUF6534 domain-containing protein n=1 Tax=Trametes cubensis TaxID=1111947 RepID=A0AAD7TXA6_9APHY|nr:hypothetical protein ONZ51_g3958 [Trametes cubensis]